MRNTETLIKKRFTIRENWVGLGYMISVPNQEFFYDHDEAYKLALKMDNADDRTHRIDKAISYSQPKGVPSFVKDIIFYGGYKNVA